LNPPYFVASELIKEIELPKSGMLSRTLYDDGDVKLVLFGFSAGHELSAHSAPMPASLFFLEGEATLALGADTQLVKAGAFVHMPPHLMHAVVARTPLVMLLMMMKGVKQAKLGQAND
jgi:quercetin dioxygenase-like cupin family protein